MKNTKIIFLITMFSFLVLSNTYARKLVPDSTSNGGTSPRVNAEGCSSAQAYNYLEINNVRCRINTGGDMWWDLQGVPQYEVPKGSRKHSMFNAALWIGGKDVNGKVKVAAQRYRSYGDDYWTGPLTTDGSATTTANECKKYDRHWILYKKDVEEFYAAYNYKLENEGAWPEGYTVPDYFYDYPALGDQSIGQSKYLAPFYDWDNDGNYNPDNGDYPYYEVGKHTVDPNSPMTTMEGNGILKDQILKGDMTLWWIFNDKGNIHTESQGDATTSIGFEIRAQAFGFATNDELNDMTFYTYEIINRSTFRLDSTYFSQWVDTDVGEAFDDYVGCDVERGLGYCYNGEFVDGTGQESHYGENPPAIGVDFFQGPYMNPIYDPNNPDSAIDRPLYDTVWEVVGTDTVFHLEQRCDESVNGVNFGDGIGGNERYGMRRFLYHNNTGGPKGDPRRVDEYYNMLRGLWKGGEPMSYGGDAYETGIVSGVTTAFMFPGETDPCNWGTISEIYPNGWDETQYDNYPWTEEREQNDPDDRRFMQSAGPFTLEPGAVNYITVGIPWARASSGTPFQSVRLLKLADDKCQKLFDNNFRIINGPEAPMMTVQELDQELILFLDYSECDYGEAANFSSGCNYQAHYEEFDYNIQPYREESTTIKDTIINTVVLQEADTIISGTDTIYIPEITYDDTSIVENTTFETIWHDTTYNFEGYKIYQLKDNTVSVNELDDPDKARLIAQCDIKNGVDKIVNYYYDPELDAEQAVVEVNGADKGITHSFRVFYDQFATGNTNKLVNNRPYYFMAIAYAHNDYLHYTQNSTNEYVRVYGQKAPYLAGRSGSYGGAIKAFTGIPHIPQVENGGTVANSDYGDGVEITRLEGNGNGSNVLRINDETVEDILDGESDFPDQPYRADVLQYEKGYGPLDIKVVDPLNVKESDFSVKLLPEGDTALSRADYIIVDLVTNDTMESHRSIDFLYEQLLIDYGISISIYQPPQITRDDEGYRNRLQNDAFLGAEIVYEEEDNTWLSGIPDDDLAGVDWIASGGDKQSDFYLGGGRNTWFFDANEQFEDVIDGTWAPYGLSKGALQDGPTHVEASNDIVINNVDLADLASVMVVFTDDKDQWSRCPVVEIGGGFNSSNEDDLIEGMEIDGTMEYPVCHSPRFSPSVDKDGNPWTGDINESSTSESDANFISGYGMGWFPGYAINLETGERLNIMFGENSKFCPENEFSVDQGWPVDETGRDMIWNPTSTVSVEKNEEIIDVFGSMHYIYVFGAGTEIAASDPPPGTYYDTTNSYDYGQWMMDIFKDESLNEAKRRHAIYTGAMWTTMPVINDGYEVLGTEAHVYLNVAKPYRRFYSTSDNDVLGNEVNNGYPLYKFNTRGMGTTTNQGDIAKNALDLIRIVPNPYNAFSDYETDQLDTRIRITNLPQRCDITIYSLNGTLIRELSRDDATITSTDWDLKNYAGIPISSGVYLIHIRAEGIGEQVVKFFCTMRPTDLNSF